MLALNRPEEAPIRFQSAWNAHDMTALGDLFTADATFINRFGHMVRGVDEIVALHAPIHETVYRDSTLENEVIDVRYLGEDVAVVHFWSRLSVGESHPAGPHQVDTLILAVLTKQDTGWLICAFENVTLTNPRTGETILRNSQ
ncbi:MAG: SgcJ/EcaC family oxidoreductase [Acidobacteriota bacterium]